MVLGRAGYRYEVLQPRRPRGYPDLLPSVTGGGLRLLQGGLGSTQA
ncbi:unnamed protein product [Linum tenue]|uniref:Uncharacterized protein n=1 Tax=Linum tenue TaxID=586396 RepID=A0AAV0S5T5_9ROSI|nr:unnamed protein product [Linum tenue]